MWAVVFALALAAALRFALIAPDATLPFAIECDSPAILLVPLALLAELEPIGLKKKSS